MFDQCKNGGWQLGHLQDGTQAEYIRMPFADSCLYHLPPGVDERSLLVFSDILPTGLEVGALRGNVTPGSTIAIVGAGPVGLAAGICSQLYSPSKIVYFDKDEERLKVAKKIGASHTIKCDNAKEAREAAKEHFKDVDGFDVVMEAVGVPATFEMCQELVGIGGRIANIGVHGTKVDLSIEKLWPRSICESNTRVSTAGLGLISSAISMALVSSHTIPLLLQLQEAGKLDTSMMVTHGMSLHLPLERRNPDMHAADFKFSQIEEAYDVFTRAAETKALKVNIEFD